MDLITYLEDLSYITLTDTEKQRLSGDLQEILNSMTLLNELKTEAEDSFYDEVNVFRDDEVKPSVARELILKNAPESNYNLFLAPGAREDR